MIAEDTNESNTDDEEIYFPFNGGIQFAQNKSNSPRRALDHNTNAWDSSPPSYPSIEKESQTPNAPPSPDRTVAETVESSNWSLDDNAIGRHSRGGEHSSSFGECNIGKRTMEPLSFWNFFFNPHAIIGACKACFGTEERQERRVPSEGGLSNSSHSNDCFVRVDCADTAVTRLMESDYSWNDSYYYPYAPMDETSGHIWMDDEEEKKEEVEPTPREQPQQPTQYPTSMINKLAQRLSCRMTYPPPQLRQVSNADQKLTPISEDVKSSKYDAFSSLNTLHRRNDHYSVSFFTSETLDAIHTSPASNAESLSPRDRESGVTPRRNPLEYKTPPNRSRADSDTFRRTMQVVTCEKRVRDEVSPIPMDTPRFDNTTPRRQNEHQPAGEQTASHKKMDSVVNLFEEEFMVDSFMSNTNDQCSSDQSNHDDEVVFEYDDDAVLLWPETYLQKSPSYIKALRKSGRKGKCLIQGWVAFRQSGVSWDDIIRNPRRCDFQYVVLLDDMPLLHIFPSRPKNKKTEQKKNILDDCITFDLSNDIGFETQLASQELGNEICIVNTDNGAHYCSILPISMPHDVFQDKHKSRIAKSDALTNVFASSYQQEIITPLPLDEYENSMNDPLQYSKQIYAPQEQYDVSRHLIFVLDAAVQFPLPRS